MTDTNNEVGYILPNVFFREFSQDIVSVSSLLWVYQTVILGLESPNLASREAVAVLSHRHNERFMETSEHVDDFLRSRLVKIFNKYHDITQPKNWAQVIVKILIGDIFSTQFYKVRPYTPLEEKAADYLVGELKTAVDADPSLAQSIRLYLRRIKTESVVGMQFIIATVNEKDDGEDAVSQYAFVNEIAEAVRSLLAIIEERQTAILELLPAEAVI